MALHEGSILPPARVGEIRIAAAAVILHRGRDYKAWIRWGQVNDGGPLPINKVTFPDYPNDEPLEFRLVPLSMQGTVDEIVESFRRKLVSALTTLEGGDVRTPDEARAAAESETTTTGA